jgi:hypothetical protein
MGFINPHLLGLDETKKQMMEDIFVGDFSNIPGLDPSMQETLSALMNGDFNSVISQLKETYATSDTFETLRQELLKTSSDLGDTLAALGLTSDMLSNPKAFQREVQGKVNGLLENVQSYFQSQYDSSSSSNTVTTSKRTTVKKGKANHAENARGRFAA